MTKVLQGLVAVLALAIASSAMAAAEPTLQEVNSAVRAGHLQEAQSMMLTVLSNHPGSAKAHFVESEVLERLARRDEAQRELARAEQIDPKLTGIPLDTVDNLRSRLAAPVAHAVVNPPAPSFPWGPVLLIGGAVLLVVMVLRARRPTVIMPAGGAVGGPYGTGYGPGYGAPGYGPAPMGGGIGSGILGGLATGAAVGAGMVAGEALASEFMGHHDSSRNLASNSWDNAPAPDTSDLGVGGGWDSGGGSDLASGDGGGDWS